MNQTFHGIWQLYIETVALHTGNNTFKIVADVVGHIFCFVAIFAVALDIHSVQLTLAAVFCRRRNIVAKALFDDFARLFVHICRKDAMDDQVRVTADRGGKVSIIVQNQTKVTNVIG